MSDVKNSGEEQLDESQTLAKIDNIVKRNYLRNLSKLPILPLSLNLKDRKTSNTACIFPIKKIVYDREENNLQKMMNVFVGAATIDASLVMIINHPQVGKDVEIYLGICSENSYPSAHGKATIFYDNFMGNFPGCQTGRNNPFLTVEEIDTLMDNCLKQDYHALSSVSGVASLRKGFTPDNVTFFQGIEKLIDGMEDRVYSAIILANAISNEKISDMQAEYENLYHMISPLAQRTISLSRSKAETLSKTISDTTSKTLSHTKSTTLNVGETYSETHTEGNHKGSGDAAGVNVNVHADVNSNLSAKAKIPFIGEAGVQVGVSTGIGIGGSYSHSEFRGKNWSNTTSKINTKSKAESDAETEGETLTVTSADGKNISETLGQSQQITYANKTIKVLLSIIDKKIQRLNSGMEQGMFAVATYFSAPDLQGVNSAASIYKSLIIGDQSQIESSGINSWQGKSSNILKSYLKIFCHPRFSLYETENVTPATVVTSD